MVENPYQNPYRTGFVESRARARFASRLWTLESTTIGNFGFRQLKIQNWYMDSNCESLYYAGLTAQSMCRLTFFLADSKKDLPRITQSLCDFVSV
jgi:hypothetical protein